ncbi:uncharacterized protein LOC125757488 [Rhipicephalus sanguineus]|uniref:uncharacterized protein LOC125757488 n=1 Tax=Rhipicephalus sanguineus TaxID=34632 RepID=UPI0020C3D94A|nr:uncharacterized protein LOC125757488 [Rhipicephalus sanguineus]
MQQCWEQGTIPQSWKLANLILIPKPGKSPTLANLRPISLTSCVGKLMEHVVQTRLIRYLEDHHLLPDTMFGFRPHLAAPDIMLLLKHQVLYNRTLDTQVIVGLDVSKAFDNVHHTAILQNLQALGVGNRTYTYVRDFLTNRQVQLDTGEGELSTITPGSRGTPQGSVLSPLLFNVALLGLPELLADIPNLHHTLYADDLTLWVTRGSDGQIEETLQTAIDRVGSYLSTVGLSCSATKSEYIVIPSQGRKPKQVSFHLQVQGMQIPQTDHIRILGLHLQANGGNSTALQRIDQSAIQIGRLLKRVANKHAGMRESNLLRLVQAFVCTRVTYVAPYLRLTRADLDRLDASLRKAYKTALGLPMSTSTSKLMALGVSNTVNELIEATLTSQYQRLSLTHAGRAVLHQIGLIPTRAATTYQDIPTAQRLSLCIPPLPKHMHPEHHAERRADRARQLQKRFASRPDVTYTDASRHPHRSTMVAVALAPHRGWSTACSVIHSTDITVAEEVAIALAMTDRTTKVIVSDPQLAIRNFDAGRISTQAYSIIKDHTPPTSPRLLIWAPAHESLSGNVQAHTLARDLNYRVEFLTPHTSHSSPSQACEKQTPLFTYTDILQHYRLGRLHYPPAHKDLPRRDAVLWRKLQTGVFPNPWLYSKVYPHLVTPHCRYCSQSATLIHMAWTCPQYADASHTEDTWESLLRTTDSAQQRRVISRALEAAASQGIPADLL